MLALDRDPSAAAAAEDLAATAPGRFTFMAARFGALDAAAEAAGFPPLDGVALDIGVSSMQLDEAARGFSFRQDGPLDMRMGDAGGSRPPSAADLVNGESAERLADILYHYGEERLARPVARAIVAARAESRIETTAALAAIVARIIRQKPGDIHPATRTFQALRIAVNDELGELVAALHAAERALAPGGRLVVVTFHSLEDRIVKRFLASRSGRTPAGSRHAPVVAAEAPTFTLAGRQPVTPGPVELASNPRARSAKLRAAVRTGAAARATDSDVAALALLPETRPGRR